MALSKNAKSTINLVVPTSIGGITFFLLMKKGYQVAIITAIVVVILSWIITAKITKAAYNNSPAPVPTGGGCDGYDPTGLIDAIHEDQTCTFCTRDRSLYDKLLALADCQLIKAYNLWNDKYYTDTNYTLPGIIAKSGDSITTKFDLIYSPQVERLADRFKTLNLQ